MKPKTVSIQQAHVLNRSPPLRSVEMTFQEIFGQSLIKSGIPKPVRKQKLLNVIRQYWGEQPSLSGAKSSEELKVTVVEPFAESRNKGI